MLSSYSIHSVKREKNLTFAIAIRAIVFVEEQACPFSEAFDHSDTLEHHLVTQGVVMYNNERIATARILYVDNTHAKIGRIAVLKSYRNQGLATELITHMIKILTSKTYTDISIHAQEHLETYYKKFDFKRCSETFEEAGI